MFNQLTPHWGPFCVDEGCGTGLNLFIIYKFLITFIKYILPRNTRQIRVVIRFG